MWRPWRKIPWNIRLSTLMLLTLVAALSIALYVQHEREIRLARALFRVRHFNEAAIQGALDAPFKTAATPGGTMTLQSFLKTIRASSITGALWDGIPIYVDPVGLQEAGQTMIALIAVPPAGTVTKTVLESELARLKLDYVVKDGILTITSQESVDRESPSDDPLD